MSMVVSEQAVEKTSVVLARVLADPPALMNSNYQTILVRNNLVDDGVFTLDYSDLGNDMYVSALKSTWDRVLPKWKCEFLTCRPSVRSFVRPFARPFVRPSVRSFVRPSVRPCVGR